jgi:hypothetical protein
MRRVLLVALAGALGACHAHETAGQAGKPGEAQTIEKPPETPQVSSARPVRTTPGGMLDPQSLKQIQAKLSKRGFEAPQSGQLDEATEAALRKFQHHEKIAATGLPDFDTLRRLGLDPKKMYLGGTQRRNEAKR